MIKKLYNIDLSSIKPLCKHYEAFTIEDMTCKLSSIPTFQTVQTARREVAGGFVADINTRYFTEDFPWGLCIIKGFCEICDVHTPTIDRVLHWYEGFMDLEYYVNERFCGKDLKNTGIPQNFGINTKDDIYNFYLLNDYSN